MKVYTLEYKNFSVRMLPDRLIDIYAFSTAAVRYAEETIDNSLSDKQNMLPGGEFEIEFIEDRVNGKNVTTVLLVEVADDPHHEGYKLRWEHECYIVTEHNVIG